MGTSEASHRSTCHSACFLFLFHVCGMSLEAAEVSRSVRAFRSRVETVVEAGGGRIE
ncbi:Hypothetical protein FKW44_012395 [Caligus rogercresseyi]|uniref:Uncharacterized protein n=1 Tax=Caligus rogercresseyi TaxID=217165 RepID=A0A7T8KAV2_CALRO|nr:Hypothetical protein FKW44_012395 [Caligus rogercresseyi]